MGQVSVDADTEAFIKFKTQDPRCACLGYLTWSPCPPDGFADELTDGVFDSGSAS